MLKIVLIAIVIVVISLMYKEHSEYGAFLGIALCVIVAGFVLEKVEVVHSLIVKLDNYISLDMLYIELLMKIIGITYIAEIGASICKDAGYGGVAKQIEIGGKFTILSISMPVLIDLLDIVSNLL